MMRKCCINVKILFLLKFTHFTASFISFTIVCIRCYGVSWNHRNRCCACAHLNLMLNWLVLQCCLIGRSVVVCSGMMDEVVSNLKLEQHALQQQLSPVGNMQNAGIVAGGSGAAMGGMFNFSRASSIGSVNAVSYSSASSTHNTGLYCSVHRSAYLQFATYDACIGSVLQFSTMHSLLQGRLFSA